MVTANVWTHVAVTKSGATTHIYINGADVTVACIEVPVDQASGFGVMHVDAQDPIVNFIEKPAGPPGIPVDPDTLHDAGLRGAPAEQGADPGEELGHRERLDDVVVGAGRQAADAVCFFAACGEHHHGQACGFFGAPQLSA